MIEIKFRAWDKKDKIMRVVYGIQFPKISNHGNRENTIVEMHCSDYDGQKAIILSDFTDSVDRVQLMQYAGLKDKNGKEIYEGDIFKRNGHYGAVKYRYGGYYVVFDDGKKIFLCSDIKWNWEVVENEVIGNIYSNPELL